jgi:hypothetical protein
MYCAVDAVHIFLFFLEGVNFPLLDRFVLFLLLLFGVASLLPPPLFLFEITVL